MYMPPAFRQSDRTAIIAAIQQSGLGNLITATNDGPFASPLPFFYEQDEGESGTLYAHLARANPQWKTPPIGDALVTFMGPDAYVSPSYYPSKAEHGKVVPTWNYVSIHASGPVEFFEDRDRLRAVVERLTARHEHGRSNPWQVSDAPEDFISAQLKGIIGVRIPVRTLEGKWKMSQNRNDADKAGVKAGLAASTIPTENQISLLIPDVTEPSG